MSDNEKEKLQKLMIAGDLQPAIAFLEEMMAIDPTIINTGLNMNGSTCLIFANKHLELTMYLVEKGADVNAANKYGKTPLIYACNGGKVEVVKYLFSKGANLYLKDKDGKNALEAAVDNQKHEIAVFLVQNGLDPYAAKQYCQSPMDKTHRKEHKEELKNAHEIWCQAHGNGRNNSLPDAPSPPAYVPSTAVAANTSTFGGGGSTDIGQLPSSSSITSAAVEKLTNEVVGIRVTCNSVKQECGKLRQEVASLALIQSQMREEFKHALLSIDSRLASLQSDNKVVKAAVDLSLAPRTAGVHNSQVLGALGNKSIAPTGAKIDGATGDLMDVVTEGREI